MVVMTLYKDLHGIGFDKLTESVHLDFKIGHSSLQHNVHAVRESLLEWSKDYIQVGSPTEWHQASRHCNFKEEFSGINLWIDSSDFPLTKNFAPTSKYDDWSPKLKKAGKRYMTVREKGIIRKIWGGYSPKINDGIYLEDHVDEFEDSFANAHFVGDTHFHKGKRLFRKLKFTTPLPVSGGKRKRNAGDEGDDYERATEVKKAYNQSVHACRNRVEIPFATVKNKFNSLTKPWSDSARQHKCLVNYAAAVVNVRKLRNM